MVAYINYLTILISCHSLNLFLLTVIGSLGAFFPFDKGLAPIKDGTPWPIQGVQYHLSASIDQSLRACIKDYTLVHTEFIQI